MAAVPVQTPRRRSDTPDPVGPVDPVVDSVVDPDDACLPTLSGATLARADAERLARALKAVADPTRLQLLSLLRETPDGAACVCDLTAPVGLRQPTVSHHLKVLVDAGLLERERRGSWVWYSLVPDRLDELRGVLS